MESNKASNDAEHNIGAMLVVILQLFAWAFTGNYFSGDYTGSDAAGNGMARGMAVIVYIIPSMVFIFLSNLYLLIKKSLVTPYRYIAVVNFVGLIILFNRINW